jgi:hypothetical protein
MLTLVPSANTVIDLVELMAKPREKIIAIRQE